MTDHTGHTLIDITTYADPPKHTYQCVDCGITFTEEHRP